MEVCSMIGSSLNRINKKSTTPRLLQEIEPPRHISSIIQLQKIKFSVFFFLQVIALVTVTTNMYDK